MKLRSSGASVNNFAQLENPQATLQHAFGRFTCLTEGDIIRLLHGMDSYELTVQVTAAFESGVCLAIQAPLDSLAIGNVFVCL